MIDERLRVVSLFIYSLYHRSKLDFGELLKADTKRWDERGKQEISDKNTGVRV